MHGPMHGSRIGTEIIKSRGGEWGEYGGEEKDSYRR